jgi:hypothetical protein
MNRITLTKLFFLLMIISVFFHKGTIAQENEASPAKTIADSIRHAEPIFFYGFDFSHVRISDGPKIPRSNEYSKVYPSAWLRYLEKEIILKGYVQRALRKRTFYYKQDAINAVSMKVVPDFIIADNYSFPVDTVRKAVQNYPITEKAGIGMVIIPENFNKPQERCISWIVFFDIRTREVLWSTEVSGACSHMGYTAHWGSGIIEGFKRFISKYYRVRRLPPLEAY